MDSSKKKILRNVFYGLFVWLIPFVVSVFFYKGEGELTINIFLFKSIMIVTCSFTAAILLVSYFKHIDSGFLGEGITVGVAWLAISLLLDLLVLIPMSGMSVMDYFAQIGLRYLSIPAMTIAVGAALANRR